MKTCKDCKKEKENLDFYGVQSDCKDCTKSRVKQNRNSNIDYYKQYDKNRQKYDFNRIFRHRYSGIKARVEGRASRTYKVEGKPMCTLNEFINWCHNNMDVFLRLHRIWKRNSYKRGFSPSIDRINNNKGYTLDNIQWILQKENCSKYNKNLNYENTTTCTNKSTTT